MSEALLIGLKPYVKCVAEGDVSNVAERVGSDADRALRCGRPCVAILAHGPLPALLAVADGHLSRRMAHMMDATNSVDELVMVGASSIEAGCQFTIRTKIDNFFTHPAPRAGAWTPS